MEWVKVYGRGFLAGMVAGAIFLTWVYRVAQQFPGDPSLNRYYLYIRALEEKK